MKYDDDEDILNLSRDPGFRIGGGKFDADLDDEDGSDLKDSAGVKVIRYEEDIKAVFTSRNTCNFGYVAVIGVTKLTIYLAYADEIIATYDQVLSLNQWDFRVVDAGVRVELLDFTDSGERFVFYSNTGEIVSWSLKNKRFD